MDVQGLQIMAVDDQPGVRFLLDAIFQEEGHKTYLAANGLEALDQIKKSTPDLIFMDLRMPVMDGKQTVEAIKAMGLHTEIVIMTAFSEKDVIDSIRKIGEFKYLSKPFDVDDVRTIVREAAHRKITGQGNT